MWPLYDAAEEWVVTPPGMLIGRLLPLLGLVWVGGLPKLGKSLLVLDLVLAVACGRETWARDFRVLARPRILYVAREDSIARIHERILDILSGWGNVRPEPGMLRFIIGARINLLNPTDVATIREICLREGIRMVVLDTWTALSPSANPLNHDDQAKLVNIVRELAEDIRGLVVVVDHTRKNRAEGQPTSSADVFGPYVKWAGAEHILVLDRASDNRLEIFVEGKDVESMRFLLMVSPPGSGQEKFVCEGSATGLAEVQWERRERHREAVGAVLRGVQGSLASREIVARLRELGVSVSVDTVQRILSGLIEAGQVRREGQGRSTRYCWVHGSSAEQEAGGDG